jgi:hypothetical protein
LEAIIITVMVLEMKALTSEAGSQKSGVRRWDGPAVNGRVLWANWHLVFWSRLRRLMCGRLSKGRKHFRSAPEGLSRARGRSEFLDFHRPTSVRYDSEQEPAMASSDATWKDNSTNIR